MVKYLIILSLNITFLHAQLKAKLIATDFNQPLYITNYPSNNDMLLIVEQNGIIKIVNHKQKSKIHFLDITDRVHQTWYPADERGLLGLTFDPDFDSNHYFYINYINQDHYTTISRFKVVNGLADSDSEEVFLQFKQPYMNHNGGFLEFGPDGYLYISIGDGGSVGDPENRAQDLSNLFGTIIRIDVQSSLYNIPKNNPFYKQEHIKSEIWNYGFRNVWRFSFDKKTGDLYMGDVGQYNWEEINFQPHDSKGGLNFGWKLMEGNRCYGKDNQDCNSDSKELPIFEYPNDASYVKTILGWKQADVKGCSITGGYVYRGSNIDELYGRYFFGDYCTGKIWSLDRIDNKISIINHTKEVLQSIGKTEFYLSSFGEDENGELYVIDYSGSVYSITK